MISPSHLVFTAKSFTSYKIEDITAVVMSLRTMMSLKMTTIGLHRKSPLHWPASPPSPVLLAPFFSSLGSSCSMGIECIKDILQFCTSSSYIECFLLNHHINSIGLERYSKMTFVMSKYIKRYSKISCCVSCFVQCIAE